MVTTALRVAVSPPVTRQSTEASARRPCFFPGDQWEIVTMPRASVGIPCGNPLTGRLNGAAVAPTEKRMSSWGE